MENRTLLIQTVNGPCKNKSTNTLKAHYHFDLSAGCCTDLLPSTERKIERDTEKDTENIKQVFFLFTRVLLRVKPTPLISFRHTNSSPLVSVCASVAKSICLFPTSECVCVCVYMHECVCMCLLVFFSRSKVELHGFVHLPVLFADQFKGEGTIQNSELVSSSRYVDGVLFL